MGFVLQATYDVNACAQSCNARAYDHTSGPCIYFNIWQAVVNGTPSAVTCSMVCSNYSFLSNILLNLNSTTHSPMLLRRPIPAKEISKLLCLADSAGPRI